MCSRCGPTRSWSPRCAPAPSSLFSPGVVGWVMVLRKESFAGHTLAVVGFPGAAAAAWLGVATGYGYFAACIGAAVAIAAAARVDPGGRAERPQ